MLSTVAFVVENAGCHSCAGRVRSALEGVGEVAAVAVDEAADTTSVRLVLSEEASVTTIDHLLEEASTGSGHAYRVRPGSWVTSDSA